MRRNKHTVESLRETIHHLEDLIKQSQSILKSAEYNQSNPRASRQCKVKSDCIHLKYKTHSLEHLATQPKHTRYVSELNQQLTDKKHYKIIHISSPKHHQPILIKPKHHKPHLYLDINSSGQFEDIWPKTKQNILIEDQMLSPINRPQYEQTLITTFSGLDNQSFEDSHDKYTQKPSRKRILLKKKNKVLSTHNVIQETFKTKRQHNPQQCQKYTHYKNKLSCSQFLEKVRKYEFVQRYLTQQQIIMIYQQLKTTSLPHYRWPLIVIDQVYSKMRNLK